MSASLTTLSSYTTAKQF